MKLTVVSNPVEGGDVTAEPASGDGRYYPSDNVALTATARPGWVFAGWTGDVSEVEDTGQATIVVELNRYYVQNAEDLQITASFARDEGFPWVWLAVGLGGGLVVLASLGGLLYLRLRAPPQPPPRP